MYEVSDEPAKPKMVRFTAESRQPVSIGPSEADRRIAQLDAEILELVQQKSVAENVYLELKDRKKALEAELFALRKNFDGVEILKRPPPKAPKPTATIETVEPDDPVPPTPIPRDPSPAPAPVPTPEIATERTLNPEPAAPVKRRFHPYGRSKEPNYLPPHDRNLDKSAPVAGPSKEKEPVYREPAYQVRAPVEDPKIAIDVYNRWIKMLNLMLSTEELLSLSPEVRNKVRETVTPKRFPILQRSLALAASNDDALPFAADTEDGDLVATTGTGSFTVPDPYETYLRELPPNEKPNVFVARESHALRAINIIVNNSLKVEGILDPGCQIIAMSEEVCHALGLAYDPTIILNMQSANGEVDRSLGLARNVPCRMDTITVYLQVHIIRAAAYNLLLGRPFDVLTRSTVTNYPNEDQTITIHDPNSGRTVTIPTLERSNHRGKCEHHSRREGKHPIQREAENQVFREPRN